MGRRVAIMGAVLVTAGVALQWWSHPAQPRTYPTTPLGHLQSYVLASLPALGAALTAAGAVVLALALLTVLSGRPPVRGQRPAVLWSGIGLVVLGIAVEFLLLSGPVLGALSTDAREGVVLLLLHAAGVLRWVGAALVGLWLTGLVTGRRTTDPERVAATQVPSRPF